MSTVTVTLTQNTRIRSTYLLLFEVGILNVVCGCIFGCLSVAHHPLVTVTLTKTSDLVSKVKIECVYIFCLL